MTSDSSKTGHGTAEHEPDPPANYGPRTIRETKSEPKRNPTPLDVWSGIVFAAAFYPFVLAAIVIGWMLLLDINPEQIGTMIVVLPLGLMAGTFYGIIMSIPAFLLTQLLCWSLNGVVSERGASGIYGGMTGFLCISGGGLFLTNEMPSFHEWEIWVPWIFAYLLAIVMGYGGAIWFGYKKRHKGFPFFEPIFSFGKQITISYLMKLTFIVAASSIILKATNGSFYIVIAWSSYFIVQILLLVCDHWVTFWLSQR